MTKIDISTGTLVRFLLLLLAIGFLFMVRDVLVVLFIVLIVVAGLAPTVNLWSRYLTRPGAVITLFILIFLLISIIIGLLIPPLVTQLEQFSTHLPHYATLLNHSARSGGVLEQTSKILNDNLHSLSSSLTNLGGTLFSRSLGVVNGLVAFVTIVALSFYLLLDQKGWQKVYRGWMPHNYYEALSDTTSKIAEKLGAWLQGQLLLMVVIGVFVAIGLGVIGVPYALALGLWAGLTEIVPIIGPWIGAIPAIIIGFVQSPLHGILVMVIYLVIQQLESNFLVPKVMGRAVGLNPAVVIIALLIGDKLYGLTGVLLSVPLAAVISVIGEDWTNLRRTFNSEQH